MHTNFFYLHEIMSIRIDIWMYYEVANVHDYGVLGVWGRLCSAHAQWNRRRSVEHTKRFTLFLYFMQKKYVRPAFILSLYFTWSFIIKQWNKYYNYPHYYSSSNTSYFLTHSSSSLVSRHCRFTVILTMGDACHDCRHAKLVSSVINIKRQSLLSNRPRQTGGRL